MAFLAVPQCNGFWVLPSGDSRVCELDITILIRFNKYVSSSSSLHGPFPIAMLNDQKAFQKLVRQKKHGLSQSIVPNKPDGWLVPNLGCGQFVRPREWQELGWFLRFNFVGVRNFQPVAISTILYVFFLLSIRTSDEWLQPLTKMWNLSVEISQQFMRLTRRQAPRADVVSYNSTMDNCFLNSVDGAWRNQVGGFSGRTFKQVVWLATLDQWGHSNLL